MNVVILSTDSFFLTKIDHLAREEGLRPLRTSNLDRLIRELKKPGFLGVLDAGCPGLDEPGMLSKIKNIASIVGNPVICICPNQDEDLKKLAASARLSKVFLRYDLFTGVKEYIASYRSNVQPKKTKAG